MFLLLMTKSFMKNAINNTKKIFSNIKICMSYIKSEKYGKIFLLLKFIQSIFNVLFSLIYITLPGLLINILTNSHFEKSKCIIIVLLIIISPLLSHYLNLCINFHLKKIKMYISMNIDIKFYTHLLKMDYESYENPNVQIKKDRSKNTLSLVWNVCDILFGLISQSISIICSILVLSFFNPIIIFVTVIFSIINYFIKIYINKIARKF